jgi:alpha-D-ribose 1-methylphosphonate 5-triphosphate diphosphatase
VERHTHPRATVIWPFLPALLAHDGVVISGGTTTVLDSLSVGASMKRPERREILEPLIAALDEGQRQGAFRAEHLLHLRCEVSDPATMALLDATAGHPLTRLVSVMDHTPGDRQSPDIERWFTHMIHEMEVDEDTGRDMMDDLLERSRTRGAEVRAHVVKSATEAGVTIMSHDDRTEAHVDQAVAEGIHVSEFPCTLAAARRARAQGMAIVAGAPNYLRGGSQSGNVAVKDLLAEGLVDMFASDYVPRSLLDAAFRLAADPALPHDLPAAIALVTDAPARAAGLTDRGRIAEGLRADSGGRAHGWRSTRGASGLARRPAGILKQPSDKGHPMTPIRIGAALDVADLPRYRDWLIAGQRDLEIQDFYATDVLLGDWEGLAARAKAHLDGFEGGSASTGPS